LGSLLSTIWKVVAVQPIINLLLILSNYLFSNFGLAIIALTIIIKLVLFPISQKQLKSTKAMQDIQPKLADLQRKYARDRARLQRETMALYREAGISPVGCAVPMLIQLPIWLALYQAIGRILATLPEDFLALSQYLYPFSVIYSKLPQSSSFLWLNLSVPDHLYILPVLTAATMWVQQKQITTVSPDPQQQQQQTMMLWFMPIMFLFITLQFPSGLALYWVISNMLGIGQQFLIAGWGGLRDIKDMRLPFIGNRGTKPVKRTTPRRPTTTAISSGTPEINVSPETSTELKEEGVVNDEKSGDKREDDGGGSPKGNEPPRRNPRKNKGNRPKGR
jgi:YidC/Oxa1 family membrane protein insertase